MRRRVGRGCYQNHHYQGARKEASCVAGERDIVFRIDKAVQTTADGSNESDFPKVAGPPVLWDAWDAGWRPVPIIRDTVMNRFRSREAELREETRRQMEEARAYINWELQFQSPAAMDRQEVEFYQRVGVMGPVHSLTACPIELREDDCCSSSTELPAPSVASTSLSSKVDRCWNCHAEGHRYTQCPRPRRGTFCFRCEKSAANTKSCVSEYWRKRRECESSITAQPTSSSRQNAPHPSRRR